MHSFLRIDDVILLMLNAKCYAITYMILDATEGKSNGWPEDLFLPLRAIALNRRLSHPV